MVSAFWVFTNVAILHKEGKQSSYLDIKPTHMKEYCGFRFSRCLETVSYYNSVSLHFWEKIVNLHN